MRSMTGAGTFALEAVPGRIDVEARSVNNRFLKSSVRASGPLPRIDALVERLVRERVRRGHVSVTLRARANRSDPDVAIDPNAFAAAAAHLRALAEQADLAPPTPAAVLRVPGVVGDERARTSSEVWLDAVTQAVAGALDDLVASREREGAHLARELTALLQATEETTSRIAARAQEVPAEIKARLHARLAELLAEDDVTPDSEQVARACAAMADRADIREEVARLQAHVAHAHDLLATTRPVGKALDFLVQELHRECSTIASKANDLPLAREALTLRTHIERLREQVQNVE